MSAEFFPFITFYPHFCTDIIRFGKRNLKHFRSLGILLNVVPSKPTLCRIDDEAMSGRMSEFAAAFHDEIVGFARVIICIDGKA